MDHVGVNYAMEEFRECVHLIDVTNVSYTSLFFI